MLLPSNCFYPASKNIQCSTDGRLLHRTRKLLGGFLYVGAQFICRQVIDTKIIDRELLF